MAEETQVPLPPVEDRLTALEHQSFIIYLQLNAITKIMVEDKKLISRDDLMAEMEDIHKKVNEVTEEFIQKQASDGAEKPIVNEFVTNVEDNVPSEIGVETPVIDDTKLA